ncbi:MAG TPA: GNAT family N-acetyltransferase [Pseudonocardiaceae bacterium]|nr:GNAT family N-acetyltransferase [Pseudonocardiaceae bacterium]
MWTARRGDRLAARAIVNLPVDGNEHLAIVQINVHPALRRQGIGTELLHALEPVLRERGRARMEGWHVTLGGPGESWARGLGFRFVHTTMLQIMKLGEVDRRRWDATVPEGYRLVRWIGEAPNDLVEAYAKARSAIGDARSASPLWPRRTGRWTASAGSRPTTASAASSIGPSSRSTRTAR